LCSRKGTLYLSSVPNPTTLGRLLAGVHRMSQALTSVHVVADELAKASMTAL
jgi:hypothetical protein